jgi:Na+-driven multidrug efflux pump
MQDGQIKSGRLVGKSLPIAIFIIAMPALIQQLMAAMVGLFDKILAGSLPESIVVSSLDGLGVGSYVGWLIGIAMAGIGIGGQALIARAMGAGDSDQSHAALGQSLLISFVWGAIFASCMWLLAPQLAALALLEEQVQARAFCIEYVRIMAYGLPFFGIMMVGGMCMHGAGESLVPSVIAVLVNVVNIVVSWVLSGADLDWLGVEGVENPFGFDLYVAGIAWGSAVSFACGALLTLIVLARGIKDLRLHPDRLLLDRSMSWRVVRIGIPNFFEGLSMWMANLVVLWFIGEVAEEKLAASMMLDTSADSAELSEAGQGLQGVHIIAVQWEAFSFMPGFAVGIAAGAIAGQFVGAGNLRMARRAVWTCIGIGVVIMGLMGLVFTFFGSTLTSLISDDPIYMETVPKLLLICGVMQVFFAISMVTRQALRGLGDTTWVFLITTCSSYLVRLPAAWLLGVVFEMGLVGIWIGLCGELVIRSMLFLARFMHGGWAAKKI